MSIKSEQQKQQTAVGRATTTSGPLNRTLFLYQDLRQRTLHCLPAARHSSFHFQLLHHA